jgi:PIN domain nuclease of toxin-antitoxin system
LIIADTHAWFWWLSDRTLLSPAAHEALVRNDIAISPITFWEIAMLASRNRIRLDRPAAEWLREALTRSETVVVDLSPEIAAAAALMESVRDPADRIIVATALHHNVPLVTKDHKITAAGLVTTIW